MTARRFWKLLAGSAAAMLVLAIAAQLMNQRGVHARLCVVDGLPCQASWSPMSIEAQGRPSALPSALLTGELRVHASTALLRQTCDGLWTFGPGARIDIGSLTLGPVFEAAGACADVGLHQASGRLTGARLQQGPCLAGLDTASFVWRDALDLNVVARVAPEATAACAALLPPSAGNAAVKVIAFTGRYGLAFGAPSSPGSPAATPAVGGWLRQGLASMDTDQTLRVTLADGSAMLRLSSTPGAGPAPASPLLELSMDAEGSVIAALPPALRQTLARQHPLQLRWHLDHETGQVDVNGHAVQRMVAAPRAPGPIRLERQECEGAAAGPARTVFFVEAGDQGEALMPGQIDAVFTAVERAGAGAGAGALVSVFVHGWQHSAAPGDNYVCRYAELLTAVQTMESGAARASGRPARQVIGVYVGWPGRLYADELANSTTFWNRLQAADRLGAAGALLPRLIEGLARRLQAGEQDPRADRRSMFVVTGHSMGGRAVFHAVGDRLSGPPASAVPKPDLVLLVNPAFSAELYRDIHAQEAQCRTAGMPMLLFSSETDAVTRQVYPAGQAVTYDPAAPRPAPFPEHIYTAANFAEFVTHRLRMDVLQGEPPSWQGEQTILRGFQRVPAGSDELYRDNPVTVYRQPASGFARASDAWYRMALERVDPARADCPPGGSKVVEVDRRIIPDHGTIFTPPFMEYVVRTLNRSAQGSGAAPPIGRR